jgi:hypothetical protein
VSGRRAPALVVLVAVLAALLYFSGRGHADTPAGFGRSGGVAMPVTDGTSALNSTWYCAAGTATVRGDANLTVVVSNLGDRDRRGSITWMPTGGGARPVTRPLRLAPDQTVALAALEDVTAPIVSALVELDGGEVAVEHAVSGPRGSGVAPCASESSTSWYLANGVTERDASEVLALYNPFPDDAVVDLSFSTDQGRDNPRLLQGFPITSGTTSFIKVQDNVRRRTVTAVSIVARTGRLVVDRIQSFDGSVGRSGVSLALAAPAPASTWIFPDGLWGNGLTETWHIYNPSSREAEVTLELVPEKGDAPEPLDVTIPPRSQQTFDAATVNRVASGVAHSATVRSLNGVPVVAERAVDARRPAPRRGWSSALGSPSVSRDWVFPVGEANVNTDEWIVVHNPGVRTVEVSVAALVGGRRLAVEGLQHLSIGPAGRVALRLGDHISRTPLPVVVHATGEVVAERDAYGVFRIGLSTIIGIPLR